MRLGEEGYAASFQGSGGRVYSFSLHFRSYTDSGTTSVVLPQLQAMAAMATEANTRESIMTILRLRNTGSCEIYGGIL